MFIDQAPSPRSTLKPLRIPRKILLALHLCQHGDIKCLAQSEWPEQIEKNFRVWGYVGICASLSSCWNIVYLPMICKA